jgi:acyl phosphate:glycerol-3-phosphate acyltransferase
MDPTALTLLTVLGAYFVGGIPFGYLVARWRGVDIFRAGSGNIGATNVGRVLGRRYGILVFALDFAKGALPVAAALWLKRLADPPTHVEVPLSGLEVFAGLAAFLGHVFPVYLGFRGGKGIATGAGVVAVLLPLPALGAVGTWLVVLAAFRYVSLASLAAAGALCLLRVALTPEPLAPENAILTAFCFVAAALIFLRHRGNLTRLVRGTENRLQDSPAMRLLAKTLHVLAVGLWFGSAVFFSFVVALSLFDSFESAAREPQAKRPVWFPVAEQFDRDADRKEQGTRAAGYAVGPLFDAYFLLQGVCGLIAVVTAMGWWRAEPGSRVHKLRAVVLLLALGTVAAGWPIEQTVSRLRDERNKAVDREMQSRLRPSTGPTSTPPDHGGLVAAAGAARRQFGTWHLISLLLNFVTVLLVTVAMMLAARLPERPAAPASVGTLPLSPQTGNGGGLAGTQPARGSA